MNSLLKWFYRPRRDDPSLMAQFYYADDELNLIASELDSFDSRKDPERCTALVNQLRLCQDRVVNICMEMMTEVIADERACRDFRVKFPDDVMQENLAGQLWFGAECLAAGSSILNRESESSKMRPLAKAVTKTIENVRNLLREQHSLISQEQVDNYDPVLMFTIPRLAIVAGLVIFPDGPLNLDKDSKSLSEMFRPFKSLLNKIRELLWTMSASELAALEKCLCSMEEPDPLLEHFSAETATIPASAYGPLAYTSEFVQKFYANNPVHHYLSPELSSLYPTGKKAERHERKRDRTSGRRSRARQERLSERFLAKLTGLEDRPKAKRKSRRHRVNGNESSTSTQKHKARVNQYLTTSVVPQARVHVGDVDSDYEERFPNHESSSNTHQRCYVRHFHMPRSPGRSLIGSVNTDSHTKLIKTISCSCGPTNESNACTYTGDFHHTLNMSDTFPRENLFDCNNSSNSGESESLLKNTASEPLTSNDFISDNANSVTAMANKYKGDFSCDYENSLSLETASLSICDCRCSGQACGFVNSESSSSHLIAHADTFSQTSCKDEYCNQSKCTSVDSDCNEIHGMPPEIVDNKDAGSCSSGSTSPHHSGADDDEEVALALQTAEVAASLKARARFADSKDLIHRLFVCISGVADQLQTNYAGDLRKVLKSVFLVSQTVEEVDEKSSEGQSSESERLSVESAEDALMMMGSPSTINSEDDDDDEEQSREETESKKDYYYVATSSPVHVPPSISVPSSVFNDHALLQFSDVLQVLSSPTARESNLEQPEYTSLVEEEHNNETIVATSGEVTDDRQEMPKQTLESIPEVSVVEVPADSHVSGHRRPHIHEPPVWVPDHEAARCMACGASFTVVRRRHHCRNCGKLFCGQCSQHTAPLPHFGIWKAVRVCNICFLLYLNYTTETPTTTFPAS